LETFESFTLKLGGPNARKCVQNFGCIKMKDTTWKTGEGERTLLEWMLKKQRWRVWTEFAWLRISFSYRLLWRRKWTIGFH